MNSARAAAEADWRAMQGPVSSNRSQVLGP
jgi:hypothetical protein